ncbi:hypothetical protein EX87_22795 (plasmid) [Brevibacillus laterosporus]|uniref:Uncharacterized protein n=1 Tax=Brevibacillus laterosporus TaxID=1465 RepID=A0A0F7EJY4_BRELA|nr:hypothetical protein EX87_22795 [Brevibacillus laterosporus]
MTKIVKSFADVKDFEQKEPTEKHTSLIKNTTSDLSILEKTSLATVTSKALKFKNTVDNKIPLPTYGRGSHVFK